MVKNSLDYITRSEAKKLSKRASRLDFIDAFTGPISSLCMYSGSEYLFNFGVALSVAEFALLKLPFMFSYVSKTKDYSSLLFLAPKEAAANFTVAGGFLDIVPAYKLRVDYVLRGKL